MLSTGLVYPLKQVTAVSSLGVVYLLAVVIVSAFWGAWLGIATAVMSAAAFNFFHLPPVGRFTIADSRNWIAVATFFVAAIVTSTVSERARSRAIEAERRRAEADLTAEMAQLLLARSGVDDALALIGRRLAQMFELPWATIALGEQRGDARRTAIPLRRRRTPPGDAPDPGRDPAAADNPAPRPDRADAVGDARHGRSTASDWSPRRSRPRACAAARRSRRPCCAPSPTTFAPR